MCQWLVYKNSIQASISYHLLHFQSLSNIIFQPGIKALRRTIAPPSISIFAIYCIYSVQGLIPQKNVLRLCFSSVFLNVQCTTSNVSYRFRTKMIVGSQAEKIHHRRSCVSTMEKRTVLLHQWQPRVLTRFFESPPKVAQW